MSTNVVVPILGEAIGEARIVAWLKQAGEPVRRGDELAELETDKAMLMLESPTDGVLLEMLVPAGAMVTTGDLLARVGKPEEMIVAPVISEVSAPNKAADRSEDNTIRTTLPPVADSGARQRISPAAKRMARDNGFDPASLTPEFPGRRITTEDVRRRLSAAPHTRAIPQRRVVMNAIQRAVAANMVRSATEIPQFSVSMEIDVTRLLQKKAQTAGVGRGASLTSWLAHLVVNILPHHPLLNARYDGDGLILYETVNLGLAVATSNGLVVPVLPGAEKLSLDELGNQLDALAKTARAGKLTMAQISDGTFTISNLGMFGVSHFTPLVNPPQSAILGISAAHPVIALTETGLQQMQYITFTVAADHRVVDGAAVAQFLGDLRQSIANLSFMP